MLSEVSEAEAFDEGPSIADGEPVEPEGVDRRVLIYGIVAALALVLIGGFAFWSVGRTVSNDPANVTRQTLEAYANYDMAKILTLTTHDSIPADQSNQLLKLGEDAKAKSGGKLGLKNVRVGKVTMDGADSAKVEVTFDQLQTSGTYSPITEVFVVIRRKGQWLVQLF